ncbi:MAG: SDR family oxidoreductase [Gracilibacteraceae bacterium]|jgi:NAD(P)-dependent dehydrogenase (short-subunit alcohol dehydrogenase family)|nr:SDR family oxidoreductase [Gracilibacteraceae bacterium]
MDRLAGKTAVVTGVGSGIGRATALMFAKEGATVVGADFNAETGDATVEQIKATGAEGMFIRTNLRSREDIRALTERTLQAFGRIDILANIAGVLVHKPFLEQNDDDFTLLCETNYRAYIYTMQEILPVMVRQGKGSVVNVASISALKPELNSYFYGGFKAAVNKLTIDVAKEFSPRGIRLNVVCPGPINTGMTPDHIKNSKEEQQKLAAAVCPIGRLGEPEDVAYVILFLASDEASFVTGSTYVVDGGVNISG